jgi:hypothetical protein
MSWQSERKSYALPALWLSPSPKLCRRIDYGDSCCDRDRSAYRASSSLKKRISEHIYEVRPRKDKRGVDLICDALPFGRLWYAGPNAVSNAIGYAEHYSRSHDAVIRVYDEAGNVIETHEHKGDFIEW